MIRHACAVLGRGVFAVRDIAVGEQVLTSEPPIVSVTKRTVIFATVAAAVARDAGSSGRVGYSCGDERGGNTDGSGSRSSTGAGSQVDLGADGNFDMCLLETAFAEVSTTMALLAAYHASPLLSPAPSPTLSPEAHSHPDPRPTHATATATAITHLCISGWKALVLLRAC